MSTEKNTYRIGIVEPSAIVNEGLGILLLKAGDFDLYHIDDIADAEEYIADYKLNLLIVNPMLIVQQYRDCQHVKRKYPGVLWAALVYSYFDSNLLEQFDLRINITDTPEKIIGSITEKLDKENQPDTGHSEPLTDRELDVLRLMVQGLLNKEIADKLNISIHTVISHRKNITQKTGIKTLAGLTIYALSNKIIEL